MRRATLLSLGLLFCSFGITLADAKYAAPPLGTKKCVVAFDTGSPTTTKSANGWNINATGKYNYDTAWTFKKLEVYTTYTKGTQSRNGPSWSVTDESTLATPGTFNVTFNDVAPPGEGEVLVIVARITVSKTGQLDEKDSEAKNVPVPMNCDPVAEDPESSSSSVDGLPRRASRLSRRVGKADWCPNSKE